MSLLVSHPCIAVDFVDHEAAVSAIVNIRGRDNQDKGEVVG